MADKVKKKKVKKDEAPAAEAPAPAPEPVAAAASTPASQTPSRSSTRKSSRSSKRSMKRSGSNVFSLFSTQQVAEFKEGFSMMDRDKDGILGKEDLRATWDQVGKLVTDQELEDMLSEATGPVNFTQLLSLFSTRMAEGGADDEKTIREALMTFDDNGKITAAKLKHALISWGDKFTPKEAADALDAMDVDKAGNIDTEDLIHMLVSGGDDD